MFRPFRRAQTPTQPSIPLTRTLKGFLLCSMGRTTNHYQLRPTTTNHYQPLPTTFMVDGTHLAVDNILTHRYVFAFEIDRVEFR